MHGFVCPLGGPNLAQGLSRIGNRAKLAPPGGRMKRGFWVEVKFKDYSPRLTYIHS